MSDKKQTKEIKLSEDVTNAVETLRGGFNGFDETGVGSFKDESVKEVTDRFFTEDEAKRVHKGRDVLVAATAQVLADTGVDFLAKNEKVKEATISTSLYKDTVGHTLNRNNDMVSEYTVRGMSGGELKKVYKSLAKKIADE